MCGIIGIQGKNFKEIESALNLILHRGPDDRGVFIKEDDSISLGHARLSILDISKQGHQPMVEDKTGLSITYNGEIYNFIELRKILIQDGYSFKSNTDTEVLIFMYLKYGTEMLKYLNGIFAFAIWDPKNKELFIARDRYGVKPIYYINDEVENNFSFSSELKSLLCFTKEKELNYLSIHRYLTYLYCPGNDTALKSINRMNPGEALLVAEGRIRKKWCWYDIRNTTLPSLNIPLKNLIDKTQNELRNAVHRQMISDVPLGAFLSGGLDSSSIVAFSKELNPNINCFTIESQGGVGYQDGMEDDLNYAKKAAKFFNLPLEIITVTPKQMAMDFEKMIWHLDEPIADLASLNVFYITEIARKNGIRVLLSGLGGDDIFTGYRRHQAVNLERIWNWLPLELRKLLSFLSTKLNSHSPIQRRIAKIFLNAHLSNERRLIQYLSWISEDRLYSVYTNEFREKIKGYSAIEPMLDFMEGINQKGQELEKMLLLEQRFFLGDFNLIYTDKMSMANGIEVRVPFLDNELVEFASSIPMKYKQKGYSGKWILKKAMEDFLPKEIVYRNKTGFGVPIRKWMQNEFKELIYDTLSTSNLKNTGLFNSQKIEELLDENSRGKVDASYTILSIMAIQIWCQKFLK